jgi:RNA polymerase-binding transcription factor DksA
MSPETAAALLAAERAETTARVAALTRELTGLTDATASVATDDEHDPEGTTAFDRAQVTALLAQARAHLADLDSALDRLAAGTYGTCERCGEPIPAGRLEARPAAATCVACAARR